MSIEGREPTPEELVDQLERAKNSSPSKFDRVMKRVVRDAEDLGDEHMGAVAEWVFKQPRPAPQPAPDDLMYNKKDGGFRYRSDDLNVTIELRLTIDGRKFLARETVDPYRFDHVFADNADEFEKYLRYFLHHHLGSLVHGDAEQAFFRSKLWVVRPGDKHDLQRCAHSNDTDHPGMWPRCLDGLILSQLPGVSPVPGVGGTIRRDAIRGACPCRCHRGTVGAPRTHLLLGVGVFDEDRW